MPAGRTRGWDAVCANPTSRAPTVSSAHPGSMAQAASHASVLALGWPVASVTQSQASAPAAQALRGTDVITAPLATSTSLSASCVAAALQGPCLKAAMRLAVASADLGLMALTVTAASQATTVTLTVMLVPVTLGGPWINTVERVVRAAAVLATQAPLAGSAAPASMASPAASPATALPMVPGIQPVTLQRGSVAAGPE